MASVSKRRWTHNGVTSEAWMVRYYEPSTGKRPGKSFALKKEADAFKRKVEREIEDGTHVGTSASLTVAEVCKRYLADAEKRVVRGEIGQLHAMKLARFVNLHIVPAIGHIVFKDITASDVDGLYHGLFTRLKPQSARQVLGYLATIEKFANRHRFILTNPVASALSGIRSVSTPRVREFTTEQVGSILRVVLTQRENCRVRASAGLACMVHLAACCGLRIGEMLALPWGSVDLDGATIRVRHSLTGLHEIKGPKSRAGVRDVPLPPHLVAMLRDWQDRYAVVNEWGLVFTTKKGRKLYSRNITRAWWGVLKAVGLYEKGDAFHFHALRHFAGSWWLHNAMPIADVAKLMGHASPAITMQIYAHVISTEHERRSAVASLGQKLAALPDARATQIAA